MELKLSKAEFEFLKSEAIVNDVEPIFLSEILCKISITSEVADEIRDWAGEQLQIRGFDSNYELTQEGKILESIIDKLYIK